MVTLNATPKSTASRDAVPSARLGEQLASRPDVIPNQLGASDALAIDGRTFAKIDPATGRVVCQVARSGAADVANAVALAKKAQPAWAATTVVKRGEILRQIALLMKEHRDAIAARRVGTSAKKRIAEIDVGRGRPVARKSDRRLGAALPASRIGRLIETTEGGVILQCTLTAADVEAGVNVASVSITPPRGSRVETSVTFMAEDAPEPIRPKPGEVRLPIAGGQPSAGFKPRQVAGKFLLAPKKQRLQEVQAQKRALTARATDQRAAMLAAIPAQVRPKSEPKLPSPPTPTPKS